MKAIVAVDENWGIGREGRLLIRIPADQKNFKELTMGDAVILGRKTMDTFPGKRPLEGRTNIIFSRNPDYSVQGDNAVVVHDEAELDRVLAECGGPDDAWVIGGESIYKLLLPRCDRAIVTMIDRRYDADAFFPDLSADPEWELESESDEQVYFDTTYRYQTWTRKSTTGN